jgi:hypothetical protein
MTQPLPEAPLTPTLMEDVEEILRAHDFDGPDAPYQPELLAFARAAERVALALKALRDRAERTR